MRPLVNEVGEYIIYESLKGGGSIAKAKGHDEGFKVYILSIKDGFAFIAFSDTNIIVSPLYIKFCKVLGILKFVYEVRD